MSSNIISGVNIDERKEKFISKQTIFCIIAFSRLCLPSGYKTHLQLDLNNHQKANQSIEELIQNMNQQSHTFKYQRKKRKISTKINFFKNFPLETMSAVRLQKPPATRSESSSTSKSICRRINSGCLPL